MSIRLGIRSGCNQTILLIQDQKAVVVFFVKLGEGDESEPRRPNLFFQRRHRIKEIARCGCDMKTGGFIPREGWWPITNEYTSFVAGSLAETSQAVPVGTLATKSGQAYGWLISCPIRFPARSEAFLRAWSRRCAYRWVMVGLL